MKREYDLARMRKRRNPYARILKKQITIRIAANTIDYFKDLSGETGIPYQSLIDSFLGDCAEHRRKLTSKWG